MWCLAAGAVLSIVAAVVAARWLFNPPAWWPRLESLAAAVRAAPPK